ncbi:MAG TPA: hypothetical protein VMO26_15380 [Vicinamibacterales bacterium]|nr:hypothetical protein [Vicinamibacterales bacterium]
MGSTAGYSGTPLVKKLGFKPGMRVRLLHPPGHYWTLLGVKPATMGVDQLSDGSDMKADFTHLFATDPDTLEEAFAIARAGMLEEGLVWASWPKKSSGMQTQIGRGEVMATGKKAGLVDVKVCAVDDTWSALKFVIPVRNRK